MLIICDTNILLFWADRRDRLTDAAQQALNDGINNATLACSDISFWEIAMLFRKNRLTLPPQYTPTSYIEDIVDSLNLSALPITPAIAALAESGLITHGDPADRIIAATALEHHAVLITADEKLRAMPSLHCIWE